MPSPAPCLKKFLADASVMWPNRDRESDGIMPSAAHTKANPTSDHERGNAADLTHSPKSGPDCNALADILVESKDARIKYIIWNRRIWFPTAGKRPQGWSKYTGPNPHTKHIHVSIKPESRDDLSPWPWTIATETPSKPILKYGDRNEAVGILQARLGIIVDNKFGYGTERAVRRFQVAHELKDDGIVGPATWRALEVSK